MGIPSRGNTSGQNSHKKEDSAFFQESTPFSAGTGEKKRTAPYATGVPGIARNPRCSAGRSSRIRTNGPLLPKQVRYQTAPCSAEPLQSAACTGMPYLTKFCKSPARMQEVQISGEGIQPVPILAEYSAEADKPRRPPSPSVKETPFPCIPAAFLQPARTTQ